MRSKAWTRSSSASALGTVWNLHQVSNQLTEVLHQVFEGNVLEPDSVNDAIEGMDAVVICLGTRNSLEPTSGLRRQRLGARLRQRCDRRHGRGRHLPRHQEQPGTYLRSSKATCWSQTPSTKRSKAWMRLSSVSAPGTVWSLPQVFEGNVLESDSVNDAIEGMDAVVICLGTRNSLEPTSGNVLESDSVNDAIEGMDAVVICLGTRNSLEPTSASEVLHQVFEGNVLEPDSVNDAIEGMDAVVICLGTRNSLEPTSGNVLDPDSVNDAIEGMDAVVICLGTRNSLEPTSGLEGNVLEPDSEIEGMDAVVICLGTRNSLEPTSASEVLHQVFEGNVLEPDSVNDAIEGMDAVVICLGTRNSLEPTSGLGRQRVGARLLRSKAWTRSSSASAPGTAWSLPQVFEGNVLEPDSVNDAIEGMDAVVICLGTRNSLEPTSVPHQVFEGNVLEPGSVNDAIEGMDAVVICLVTRNSLEPTSGNVLEPDSVNEAIEGMDAVVICLGTRNSLEPTSGNVLESDSVNDAIEGMDAVVICLGTRNSLEPTSGNVLESDSVNDAIEGMDAVVICLGTRNSLEPTSVWNLLQVCNQLTKGPLQVFEGNVLESDSVNDAIEGMDAVVICLGTRNSLEPTSGLRRQRVGVRLVNDAIEGMDAVVICLGTRNSLEPTSVWSLHQVCNQLTEVLHQVFEGNVLEPDSVNDAIEGMDAVVICLGTRNSLEPTSGNVLESDSVNDAIEGMDAVVICLGTRNSLEPTSGNVLEPDSVNDAIEGMDAVVICLGTRNSLEPTSGLGRQRVGARLLRSKAWTRSSSASAPGTAWSLPQVFEGNVLEPDSVNDAIEGMDAVVICLGTRNSLEPTSGLGRQRVGARLLRSKAWTRSSSASAPGTAWSLPQVFEGNVLEPDSVNDAIEGMDAVVICLGTRNSLEPTSGNVLEPDSVNDAIEGMDAVVICLGTRNSLEPTSGNVLEPDSVTDAIEGMDAVVICLGTRNSLEPTSGNVLEPDSVNDAIEGMDAVVICLGTRNSLEPTSGNVLEPDSVNDAIEGMDAVVICLGTRNSLEPTSDMSEGTKYIIDSMRQKNVKIVSACLSAFLFYAPDKVPPRFVDLNEDHKRMYEYLKDSNLNYIAVYPPHIAEEPSSEVIIQINPSTSPGRSISKWDLGKFLVDSLADSKSLSVRLFCVSDVMDVHLNQCFSGVIYNDILGV
ncbi:NAD(P)H-binding domain-containing protein [Phthorimaea operculella]|nr:NAD(P)H-binding domain-containing protein [Phthorimaea operculella]